MPASVGRHGVNVGRDKLVSIVTKVVKEVAKIPVWAATPSTTDIVVESAVHSRAAPTRSCPPTFTSLPLIDIETLDFEVHVDGGPPAVWAVLHPAALLARCRSSRRRFQETFRHRRHLDVRAR